jgi:cytochrome oxidase Cu insertion factor (SCO1/SenC/PrrC family)
MNRFVLTAMAFVFVFLGAITVCIAWRLSSRDMPSGTESVKKPAGYNDEILSRWDLDECHSGQMKSEDLEGKVHIVSFFFATCPGTCNLQNTHLRAIAQQYGAKGVKFLSITTDPKVDSRAALSKYAGGFSANPDHWYFLRSDDIVYLRRIGTEMYKVVVDEKVHMDRFVLVDKWGNLRLFCDWKTEKSRAELLAKMDELLAETEEPAHLDDGSDDEPRRPPGYEDELEEQAEEEAAAEKAKQALAEPVAP